jgi:hypothetical protein
MRTLQFGFRIAGREVSVATPAPDLHTTTNTDPDGLSAAEWADSEESS